MSDREKQEKEVIKYIKTQINIDGFTEFVKALVRIIMRRYDLVLREE